MYDLLNMMKLAFVFEYCRVLAQTTYASGFTRM